MKQINSCLLFVLFSFSACWRKRSLMWKSMIRSAFWWELWMNIWGMIAPSKLKARMPFIKELKNIG